MFLGKYKVLSMQLNLNKIFKILKSLWENKFITFKEPKFWMKMKLSLFNQKITNNSIFKI
jgi:hypothetical protein